MRRFISLMVLWSFPATAGLSQPVSDEQQIRATRAEFNAAIARHDVPTILTFLEEGFRTGGRYSAYWRKTSGRWLLHAEMYVPLFCEGADCR